MSRCRETDALLEATFTGTGFTRAEADHAAGCSECARALAHARRFDGELHRTGAELSPEPMPPAFITASALEPQEEGRSMTTRRLVLAGIASAVLVVAVVFGGGQWLGRVIESGAGPRSGSEAAALERWVESGLRDGDDAANWRAVRVELCDDTAVAFFESEATDGMPLYRWSVGPVDGSAPASTGQTRSVDDPTVAELRATLPVCTVTLDAVGDAMLDEAGGPRRLWSLVAGEQVGAGEPRVVGITIVEDGHRRGANGEEPIVTLRVVMDRRSAAAHWVARPAVSTDGGGLAISSSEREVFERAGAPDTTQVYFDPVELDETVFGWIGDPRVRAIDVWLPREQRQLRYSVTAPGFLVQFDGGGAGRNDEMRYKLLGGHGEVLAVGAVVPWPGAESD